MGKYFSKHSDWYPEDSDTSHIRSDFIIDMFFTVLFVIYLIAYGFFSWKSNKLEGRNIYNMITSICILISLIIHISCLQYSTWKDHNRDYA